MNKDQITNTHKDLNDIDAMNSSASISQRDEVTLGLKGAFNAYYASFGFKSEQQFIQAEKDKIQNFISEQFEYLNLPKGLDKYRIENKVIQNGSVAIVKVGLYFYAMRFTISTRDLNDEADIIIINEPYSSLHGAKYSVLNKEAIIIRNNIQSKSPFTNVFRMLSTMEKVLFQIEKNIVASAPKGLIILKNLEFDSPNNSSAKEAMERVANGQDTFYALKAKADRDVLAENDEEIFIPMELRDRTEELWKNYWNLKEEVKEFIGATRTGNKGKRERVQSAEVDSESNISDSQWKHMFNVRKIDIQRMNETFNTNVIIELEDPSEEQESTPKPKGDKDE